MMKGRLLIFEGGEGSGKSYMAKMAVEKLNVQGIKTLWTREPGGSVFAEKIRKLILSDHAMHADAETMFGLFWAARRDHIVHKIKPALEEGTHVLCERFDSSTWAYQIRGQQQGQLRHLFLKMRKHYLAQIHPSAYILLNVDPKIGLQRVKKRTERKQTHFDKRNLEFHQRVNDGLIEFVTHISDHIYIIIDANRPRRVVATAVMDTLHRLLSLD